MGLSFDVLHLRWSRLVLIWSGVLTLCLLSLTVQAQTDVAQVRDRLLIKDGIEWCFAPPDLGLERLSTACRWAPLQPSDYRHGYKREAAWLHLRLRNSGSAPLERWLEVGHPRIAEINVHYRDASGRWVIETTGSGVPRAARNTVSRHYDLIPLTVAAGGQLELWVRVRSDSQLALETTLWEPESYRERRQRTDIWLALAIGAMSLGLLFSVVGFIESREPFYLMSLLVLAGEAIIETVRTGFLSRHLWPAQFAVPIEMMAFGSMVAVLGFVGYAFRILPSLARSAVLQRMVVGLSAAVLLLQVYAMAIDYGTGTVLWSSLFVPLAALVGWLGYRDGRAGDRIARWIFMAVVVLLIIGMLRLPLVMRFLPHALNDFISPMSTMVVVLVVVLTLLDRERVIRRGLDLSRAEAASQVAFLARMSHELRTPLDIILGNAQLLMRSSTGNSELKSILENGRHLLGMVDEILDYARGICGELKLRKEPVALDAFIASVETGARLLAVRNRNRFELHGPSPRDNSGHPVLMLDPGRLRQILDNLISNAARHTQDGTIRLGYRFDPAGAAAWRVFFEISDTGEGIAREDQQRIFQPFERLSRVARYGGKGAGMGLAVARQLVALMGGNIELQSEVGLGARFSFSILAETAEETVVRTAPPEDSMFDVSGYAGDRRRVLVVDDNAGSRVTIVSMLRQAGFDVEELPNGDQAAARLARPPACDLVITDQFMPVGDGWAVLEAACEAEPPVPCILVSAAPPAPPEAWPVEQNFEAVFLKPLDHEAFLRRVGRTLGLSWVRSGASRQPPTVGSVLAPTPGELVELAAMVELGEVTAIVEWARRLRHRAPEFAKFADRVEQAATDLDFDALGGLSGGKAP